MMWTISGALMWILFVITVSLLRWSRVFNRRLHEQLADDVTVAVLEGWFGTSSQYAREYGSEFKSARERVTALLRFHRVIR